MIHEIFDKDIFTIPTDMVLCPVSPVGATPRAVNFGFNEVYPQISMAVNQANNMNDYGPGVLICLEADNVVNKRYLVAVPMCAHPRDGLSTYFLNQATRSLRKLILDTKPKTITLPAEAFYRFEENGDTGVSKYDLMSALIKVSGALPAPVDFLVVHEKEQKRD